MPGVPNRILVHTAVPISYQENPAVPDDEWIEGEPGTTEGGGARTVGVPFACLLFLPAAGGQQQNQYRPRVVTVPTLLIPPIRDHARAAKNGAPAVPADKTPIVLNDEDEVQVYAPELAAYLPVNPSRWLVQGAPQPFGPPGRVYGAQAQLTAVED